MNERDRDAADDWMRDHMPSEEVPPVFHREFLVVAFRPDPSAPAWEKWLKSPIRGIVDRWPDEQRGSLREADRLEMLLKKLQENAVLSAGMRLVLFCEIRVSAEMRAKWDQAVSALFTRLPERFGLVLSGVPADIPFPPSDDPQFLEVRSAGGR